MTPEQQVLLIATALVSAFVTAFSKQFFSFISKLINSRREGTKEADEVALDSLLMPKRVKEIHKIVIQAQKTAEVNSVHDAHARKAITASADATAAISVSIQNTREEMKTHHAASDGFYVQTRRDLDTLNNKLDAILAKLSDRR